MGQPTLEEIIDAYQQAVTLNPSDAKAHHHLAMYYSQQNQCSVALQHFEAALRAEPNFLDAHYHAGLLLFKNNEWAMAEAQFLSVLALEVEHIPAHFYLGVLALQAEKLSQAEKHFQCLLMVNPDHVPTLINLGALELKRDAGQAAISYFTQALALDGNNSEARRNLAATFMHYDRFDNALTHYQELKKTSQLEIEDLYNMGVATAALGQLTVASDYYQQILLQQATHGAALNNLAAIHIRLGRRSEAIMLLQRALQAQPNDTASQFMLEVLLNKKQDPGASQEYVRNLFNNYAFHYEQHVQKILQYSLPQQSIEMLREFQKGMFQHVLDLGCGTGLSGAVLRASSVQLTGVDLSCKMLSQARDKHIYDQLIEADIVSFLREKQQCYDLVQALDVLPYFGELEVLFDAICSRLNINGVFIFSSEISEERSWKIQDSMRFCHHSSYIQTLLDSHSMRILQSSRVVARQENEQNLYVMLMLYQKVDDNAL